MNKISIIIPIVNEVDAIHRLLFHLENTISKTIDFEIIFVDGGSNDGSQNEVEKHKNVCLISSARRYLKNSVWKLQYHFMIIHLKRILGHSAESLLKYYKINVE